MIEVNGEKFKTKGALIKKIRSVLNESDIKKTLCGEDFLFMLSILKMHPSYSIKEGPGVSSIFIKTNPLYKRNRCFWIKRIDGSETDFSFMQCLNPKNNLSKFLAACRLSISETMINFKISSLNLVKTCPETGIALNRFNSHVDHSPPVFDQIVKMFIEKYDIDVDKVPLLGSIDGEIGGSFKDESMAEKFLIFHNSIANLRLISAQANLQLKKKRT